MARRGSPLLIGVKTDKKLKVDFVDVEVAPESDKIELSACRASSSPRKSMGTDRSSSAPWPASPPVTTDGSAPSHLSVPPTVNNKANVRRTQSRAFLSDDGAPQPIEYFVASDASAIVEHTKKVLYLEDDDIAHISEGELHIHRLRRDDGMSSVRAIETLEIELAEISELLRLSVCVCRTALINARLLRISASQ
jgi:glucosamine--fructose-6-phosphate aminotransferase (isomerizing)